MLEELATFPVIVVVGLCFNPLKMSEEKHPCTYLGAGRHKVIHRKLNHADTNIEEILQQQ